MFTYKNDSPLSGELGVPWESSCQSAIWKLRSLPPHFNMQLLIAATRWIQTGKSRSGYKDYAIWVWTAAVSLCRALWRGLETAGKSAFDFQACLWPPRQNKHFYLTSSLCLCFAACYEGLQLQRPAGKTQHPHQQCGTHCEEPTVRCGTSQEDYHRHIPKKQTGKVCFFAAGTLFVKDCFIITCLQERRHWGSSREERRIWWRSSAMGRCHYLCWR